MTGRRHTRSTTLEDRDLIEGVITGDPNAADRLVRVHGPRIWSVFVDRFRLDQATADDLFQTLFERLAEDDYRRLRSWRGESSLSTWLITVARNLAVDYTRSAEYRACRDGDPEDPDTLVGGKSAADVAEVREVQRQVHELLAQLPERAWELLTLHHFDGLSYQEIAERTGMTVSHVGVVLSRARLQFGNLVKSEAPGLMIALEDRDGW